MSPSRFLVAASITISAAACSHQQQPAANPATARVIALPTPKAPAQPAPVAVAETPPDTSKMKEGDAIYFDFDSSLLRDDARPVLQTVAQHLRGSSQSLQIQGNCDETGTVEYNLALGEQRAKTAREYLLHMGVRGDRMATISYGSQRPRYPGHDEEAHAKNRRDDFVVR
jgi:peptidoglycan-associated lipoprotein